jgi:hypothetical protein
MRHCFLLCLLLWHAGLPAATASPLLVRWPLYVQGATPAERLVLYRGQGTQRPQPYVIFWDLQTVAYVDSAVRWNKGPYCYSLQAFTADDVPSDATVPVCGTPEK